MRTCTPENEWLQPKVMEVSGDVPKLTSLGDFQVILGRSFLGCSPTTRQLEVQSHTLN